MGRMKDSDIKLLQMDLLFDVKLNIKKRIIKPTKVAKILARGELEKELRRAKQEYRKAKRKFKEGKLDKNTLFDFEWHIYEIQQDIKSINGQYPEMPE